MKKLLITLLVVTISCGAFATAGNDDATSKLYVDTETAARQDAVDANNANIVMTYTDTAGIVGTKGIYDSTGSYAEQQNALVSADVANNAIMNAINMEFTCAEYNPNDETDCWKWSINTVPEQSVPNGYTALPYLESTGTQWLDLGMPVGSGENITTKFEYFVEQNGIWFGAREGDSLSVGFVFDYYVYSNSLFIISQNTSVASSNSIIGYHSTVDGIALMTPYVLNWYGNPFRTPSLSPKVAFKATGGIDDTNYLVTPPYNAYLFGYNRGGTISKHKPMRIYYFKVEGKMNLIPARRNSDGKLGMYDTIRNIFLINQGTGEFISGVYTEHVN